MSMETRTRGAEAQARYRDRLRKLGSTAAPAPETRAVTQAIATSVRGLAGNVRRSGVASSPIAGAIQSVLQTAHRRLVDAGYDRDEAQRRLLLYVRGPDPARADVE